MESPPNRRLCQPQEGLGPLFACQNSLEWKYNPLNTLLHKEDGFWRSRHACLPKSALLKVSKSRKPSPPLSFLFVSRPQFFQWIPDLLLLFCHQNLATFFSTDVQIETRSLNINIAYCESTCTTILIKISFPPFEMRFYFHPSNFALTRLRIQANISFLEPPQSGGIPKYLPVFSSTGTLSSLARFCFKLLGQALLRKIPYLFLFTACPVAK